MIVIAGLQIGVHSEMTPALQVLATVAVAGGWLAAGASRQTIHTIWIVAAVLAPAALRLAAGREGPVLDVFWMAGLTATLLRTSSWSGWSLGQGTRLLAGGWALTLALIWPIVAAREAGFDWRLLFDQGAINSWNLRSAPQVVSWTIYIAWTHLLALLWLDWLAGRFQAAPDRAPRVLHGLWIGATAASLVGVYQGVADMTFLNTAWWADRERATGTVLDANAFGFIAALAGPTAMLALHGNRSKRAGALMALVVTINLAAVWMSGSRVASLAALIGVATVARALWQSSERWHGRRPLAAAAAAAAVIAVLAVAAGARGPVQRLFEQNEDSTASMLGNVINREPYGPIAVEMITSYPLTGVGIGSYHDLAADYWRRSDDQMLPFDNAQNWWRHQAAELGLLGGLPLLLWSALIAWRAIVPKPAAGLRVQATLVRGLVIAVGVCSLVQVPTQNPVVLLWFMALVAWLPNLIVRPMVGVVGGRWPLIALAIAAAAGHVVLARGPLAVAERAKAFGREYVVGAYPIERGEEDELFRWTDDESRFVWPAQTRWFVLQMWAHHPDIAARPVRVTITTPCGLLVERELATLSPVSVGVTLAEGVPAFDATIRVSRTWQPSSFGDADRRHLGVGIDWAWVATPERALGADLPVTVECAR